MRFDDVFKRCFVVVVCFMLGVAAYFQASGMMHLTGSALNVDAKSFRSALVASPSGILTETGRRAADQEHATSADAILERNPFDSITGSLLPRGFGPEGERPLAPVFAADPYQDPPCDAARVLLISESDDPAWSFAAVADASQKPQLRRLGDAVGGLAVLAVVRDRIWLGSPQSRCQAILGATLTSAPGKGSGRPSRPDSATGSVSAERAVANKGALPPDIASKFRRVSDTSIEVDRSAIAAVMERQAELLGRVRVIPEKDGDRVAGLRISGVRPGSLLGTLGLENGDRLSKVNGMDITDPASALEVYARLSSADHLVVSVDRRGKPMNLDISIK